ncbi:hypothetical protein GNX18_06395 [Microbulbifer sp. SH-1]|uniref:hypothetical protein n=1 Tax=Microbulbifer sp. SH-1 TaxID=2681547 RepID=UPI00140C0EB8|nr:hypothetical protein [Microbulbifer sp. SH-1]QIL89434.1 hypothetical protein GNX18_06395 [Microbulbifer sp. SH-1]
MTLITIKSLIAKTTVGHSKMNTPHLSKTPSFSQSSRSRKLTPLVAAAIACFIATGKAGATSSHPAYLNDAYCESLVEQFVDSGMRSLGKYINENFKPEYKGGIRNTINFLNQRAEWLGECDSYLSDTADSRVFHDEQNTKAIFEAMDALAKELQLVREGVEYPDAAGNNNPRPFVKSRFDTLAKLVDQHHTRMLMKKQFK